MGQQFNLSAVVIYGRYCYLPDFQIEQHGHQYAQNVVANTKKEVMNVAMRPFQLLLEEELYEEFSRYFGAYGRRQGILRKAVRMFVRMAKEKMGHTDDNNAEMDKLKKAVEFEVDDIFNTPD